MAYLGARTSTRDCCSILRYQLDNGLDVILVPDHRAPTVVVDLCYKVGAINEPPGRSGFAHLFEHLMFAGTPAYPDVDAAYGALGVDINASTWDDHTLYYARGMASMLPLILSVEADRMANQGHHIDQEALDIQRDVIINEIRQNVLDSVAGAAWEAFPTALFDTAHPYSRSVYGSIPDLKAASVGDVRGFFDTYYVPNNSILTLVGDFAVDEARRLVSETFGRIPRGPLASTPSAPIPPTRARLALTDRVPTPMLFAGWAVPPIREGDLSLLRVAAELLGNGEYGVLRRELVDTGLANGAWVHLQQGVLASRFMVQVSSAEGVEIERVEAGLREAIAGFLAAPVAGADFARARTRIFVDDRMANEDPLRFADNILVFTHATDDPSIVAEDDRVIAGAVPADMAAAAGRWLQPEDAGVALVRPGPRGDVPPILKQSSGTSVPLLAVRRPAVAIPKLPPAAPAVASPPTAESAILPDGVALVHYRLPHAPMMHLAVRSPVGALHAPAGREGIIELAASLAVRGAGSRQAAAFGMAARDIGADFDAHAEELSTFITLSVPPEHLAAAVPLLADVLQRPRFDAHEFAVAKAETLSELALREADLADLAARYGEAALFPRRPGEPAIDRSIASVEAISGDDVAAAFPRIFNPETTTIYSVGAAGVDEMAAALAPVVGGWAPAAAPFPIRPREPVTLSAGRRVLVVPDEGAAQAALYVALPAPGPDEAGFTETTAVYRLLNHDFISRINASIREDLGYTYGTDGGLLDDVRRGSALIVEAPVEREVAGAAVAEILRLVGDLATDPVRDDELERTRMAYYAAMAATGQTSQGLIDEVCRRVGRGSSLEEGHRRRLAVVALELGQVQRAAAALGAFDRVLIVAAGDPGAIVPQLRAIGLDPEVLERTL